MSSPAAGQSKFDIRERFVHIDRAIVETRKLQAELSIQRDRLLTSFVVIFGSLAAVGSTLGPPVIRAVWGVHG